MNKDDKVAPGVQVILDGTTLIVRHAPPDNLPDENPVVFEGLTSESGYMDIELLANGYKATVKVDRNPALPPTASMEFQTIVEKVPAKEKKKIKPWYFLVPFIPVLYWTILKIKGWKSLLLKAFATFIAYVFIAGMVKEFSLPDKSMSVSDGLYGIGMGLFALLVLMFCMFVLNGKWMSAVNAVMNSLEMKSSATMNDAVSSPVARKGSLIGFVFVVLLTFPFCNLVSFLLQTKHEGLVMYITLEVMIRIGLMLHESKAAWFNRFSAWLQVICLRKPGGYHLLMATYAGAMLKDAIATGQEQNVKISDIELALGYDLIKLARRDGKLAEVLNSAAAQVLARDADKRQTGVSEG